VQTVCEQEEKVVQTMREISANDLQLKSFQTICRIEMSANDLQSRLVQTIRKQNSRRRFSFSAALLLLGGASPSRRRLSFSAAPLLLGGASPFHGASPSRRRFSSLDLLRYRSVRP
jgi:hypothetical protein